MLRARLCICSSKDEASFSGSADTRWRSSLLHSVTLTTQPHPRVYVCSAAVRSQSDQALGPKNLGQPERLTTAAAAAAIICLGISTKLRSWKKGKKKTVVEVMEHRRPHPSCFCVW